jgi:hypothetical protein
MLIKVSDVYKTAWFYYKSCKSNNIMLSMFISLYHVTWEFIKEISKNWPSADTLYKYTWYNEIDIEDKTLLWQLLHYL